MKKITVFGGLLLFLFVGFQPPAGMSKLPKADIDFQAPPPEVVYSASLPHAPQEEEDTVQ